jgi:hypothetical protein
MPKNVLKPFCYGEELRLRDDVLPTAKVRDWLFHKMEGEKILLEHKTKGYVWNTSVNDIDWEQYRRGKKLE